MESTTDYTEDVSSQPEGEIIYEKSGFIMGTGNAIIGIIVVAVVAVLLLIFGGALAGQTYNIAEDDINNISDATIKASVQDGIKSGFEAYESTGGYLQLLILAGVLGVVFVSIFGIVALAGMGGGRGGTAL